MPVFNYSARDSKGKTISGLVEAPSSQIAARILREKELFVINVREAKSSFNMQTYMQQFSHVGFSDVVNFTRQLATMVVAGLSLPESLSILRSQITNPAFSNVLMDIEHQITSGGNLADALSHHPKIFSPIYIALVRAGESSGMLDKVLNRMAETLESQREFQSKVKGAMIYPVIVVIGMIGVMFVMMTFVIPKLTDLYKDFGIDLPFTTRMLMTVSSFFVKFWWLMIAAMIGGLTVFQKWRKTPPGEYMVDSLILKIPIFGELQKKIMLVDFTRTLGMLISSGIHILDGLRILKNSLGNVIFRNAITEIADKVEKGFPLGAMFAQYDIFPPIVSQMIKVGEETGKVDETLVKVSRYFETESEHLVKGLTTAIEPIIMVVLGLGVGFIVLSVVTPIYNLTNQIK